MAELTVGIDASEELISVTGLDTPKIGTMLRVGSELVGFLEAKTDGRWQVVRGRERSTAIAHDAGVVVAPVVPVWGTDPAGAGLGSSLPEGLGIEGPDGPIFSNDDLFLLFPEDEQKGFSIYTGSREGGQLAQGVWIAQDNEDGFSTWIDQYVQSDAANWSDVYQDNGSIGLTAGRQDGIYGDSGGVTVTPNSQTNVRAARAVIDDQDTDFGDQWSTDITAQTNGVGGVFGQYTDASAVRTYSAAVQVDARPNGGLTQVTLYGGVVQTGVDGEYAGLSPGQFHYGFAGDIWSNQDGNLQRWYPMVTSGAGAPGGTFVSWLYIDTTGKHCYVWTGSAYVKISDYA